MRLLDNPIFQWELRRIRQSPWLPLQRLRERLPAFTQVLTLAVILGCGLICGMLLGNVSRYLGLILALTAALPAWIAPAVASITIVREREMGTLDMLRVTLLSESDIILGKLAACLARLWPGFLMLLLLVPFQFIWGGLDRLPLGSIQRFEPEEIWWWLLSGALAACHSLTDPLLYAAVGLAYSVWASSSVRAVAVAYAMTLVLSAIFWFTGSLAILLLSALLAVPSQTRHVLIASGVLPGALLFIKVLALALMLRGAILKLERL